MDSNKKNFPYKSFYNPDLNEVYLFYRQGQSFIISPENPQEYLLDRMTEVDLGQMYLIYNSALITRSSDLVLFFKIEVNEITGRREWKQYNTIHARGFIYYIKGNVRIQITTDEKVLFYLIDETTFEPTLENVMYNYMGCSTMMFGSKVRYGITYKIGEKGFNIYRRKYQHEHMVNVKEENLEGAKLLEIKSMDVFLCSKVDKVIIYDALTF